MVIVLKLSGYTHNQIGQSVGISRGQVGAILKEATVAERITKLRVNLPQAALDLMHTYSIEAVQTIVDVMRTETDWKARLQSAGEILDRGGLPKVSRSEGKSSITKEEKTTFSTDENVLAKLRELPPEKQEEAAQMIEQVEDFLHKATEG